MNLILSCITKGEDQTRATLDHLIRQGIANQSIVVLHPGGPLTQRQEPKPLTHVRATATLEAAGTQPATAVGAAASGSVAGGMFGWLVGYGVLSIPGAVLGGALGAVAGAAIGATRQMVTSSHVTDEVQHHYASRIVDDHAAILVRVLDSQQYETVLGVFLAGDCRHILTSKDDRALAESDQLEVITQHPSLIGDDPDIKHGEAVAH